MIACILALMICLAASLIVNFKLIDELERAGKRLEEFEEERRW